MTEHFLKVEVPFYYALRDGRKTFEARKNDRGYEVGDKLCLQAWDAASRSFVNEPGMEPLVYLVTYVQQFGMADGYVGLSLKPLGHLDRDYWAWLQKAKASGFIEPASAPQEVRE